MDDVTAQKLRIQTLLREGKVRKRHLAQHAQLAFSNLTGCERPDWNPRANTLAALVRAADEMRLPRRPLVAA